MVNFFGSHARAGISDVQPEHNIPYRGSVDHGIPVAEDFEPDEDQTQPDVGDLVTWDEPPEPKTEPIPVYTVPGPGKSGEVQRLFNAWQSYANIGPTRIAGRHDARTTIKITNLAANGGPVVWLGSDVNVTSMTGYPLQPGANVDLATNREVYAILDPADADSAPVLVSLLEQYSVQL